MADERDMITALYEGRMSDLSQRLANGEITLQDWQITMRGELRDSYLLQMRAGAGRDLTADDFLKLGNPIKTQDRYLAQFARDIKAGTVAPGAVASRARLYARSGEQMYWLEATNGLSLPGQPKQGTDCQQNCKCQWRIVRNDNGSVDAYWERHAQDSCDTCLQRARDWYPYHIPARNIKRAA